jgi:hypothetical protein
MRRGTIARRGAALAAALVLVGTVAASAAPVVLAPSPPTSVALAVGNHALAASWADATANATFTATATATDRVSRHCATKLDKCTISTLVNGVTYSVTVVATLKGVSSPASTAVTATVGVPGPPRLVKATGARVSALIKWSPPLATGVSAVTGYTATASPGGASCATVGTLLLPAARTCAIIGLARSSTYSVTVTAKNQFGTGPASVAVSVKTK